MSKRTIRRLLVALLMLALSGCSLGYYLHSARGQAKLMSKRTPIPEVLANPMTPAALRERLLLVQQARAFASEALGLPDKKGYRTYADLERPFAVWNVVATPEFSLQPMQWCFPVAGCVTYRGYFEQDLATAFADKLRKRGFDVAVRGVSAYSTLGFFDDPVLNTMLHWDDVQLLAIIFHELAHQLFYVKGDTPFNESFASVVEEESMRRWLMQHSQEDLAGYEARREDQQCFSALVSAARDSLQSLYESGGDPAALRVEKMAVFDRLIQAYRQAVSDGAISMAYGAWFGQSLNNAHLVAAGAYQIWVPAFRAMLARAGGELNSFYEMAEVLGRLPAEERAQALRKLEPAGAPGGCRPMQLQERA